MSSAGLPEAVELHAAHLRLRWRDGDSLLSAHTLRSACRCAHCVAAARQGQLMPVEAGIALTKAEAVGHYALQLGFSDGHDRGLYPWPMLRELGLG